MKCIKNSPPIASHLTTKRRGEVAEAAFLYKAAGFGFTVAKPWGESDRFDFFVQSGAHCWRVQVKSAYSRSDGGYGFHACGNVQSRTYTREDIDFLVAYIVPEDVWYVVPVAVFEHTSAIKLFPSSRRRMSRFEKYREAWCLLACPRDGPCRSEVKVEHLCAEVAGSATSSCPKEL